MRNWPRCLEWNMAWRAIRIDSGRASNSYLLGRGEIEGADIFFCVGGVLVRIIGLMGLFCVLFIEEKGRFVRNSYRQGGF